MAAFSVTEAMVAWIGSLGHRASSRAPAGADPPFVTVERTGGGVRDMTDHPLMAVQCWGATEDEADSLANALRLELITTQPPPGIHSVRANSGPYPFFDPETRRPRYQFVMDVACQLTT